MADRELPAFKNEEEEARWWFDHDDELTTEFEQAAAEGRLGRGTVAQKGNTLATSIRLAPDDIVRAREQAEQRGLRYQTYLKMLLHEALTANEKTMPKKRQA